MLLRDLVLAPRLHVRNIGVIHQLARNSALPQQFLAALENFPSRIRRLLRRLHVLLRFGHFLGNGCARHVLVLGLRLLVGAFRVCDCRDEVFVLQHGD